MLFNSFEFAVFLPLAFILYWFVFNRHLKLQNFFLLVCSYVFYGWWDWRFLGLLAFSSLIDYWAALQIDRTTNPKTKKMFLVLSMTMNLGLLGFFKYFNFFAESLATAFASVGVILDPFTLNIILPVGISFYTFQTMSYTIDVYRGQLKASDDIVSFLTYVSFFPQLVAGPIERAVNLLPQFYVHRRFSYAQASEGMRLMLWGFAKKIVIADNCSTLVNGVFESYGEASGIELIVGSILFAFQIYCDFSGYSDIAIGSAKLFGFELMTNFRTPYFSRDVAEFWRRWHISLTTWFRDYVYIPLGGSRVGKWVAVRNTFIVFMVSGFWHGANWTFIIWGFLNALYFLPLLLLKRNRMNLDTVAEGRAFPSFRESIQMLVTFMLVCLAWVFFRSASVHDAIGYLYGIVDHQFLGFSILRAKKWLYLLIMLWLFVEWRGRRYGVHELFKEIEMPVLRHGLYYVIISIIILFGAFGEVEFIYFQF